MTVSTGVAARAHGLVRASHAGPTVLVTAMSGALVLGAGADGVRVALVTTAVLTGQLSVGWSNDWIDAARDREVERTDKPVVQGVVSAAGLRRAALVAAAACVALSLATGVVPGVVHLAAVASAWAYNARLKATVWSPVPYALSFGLLPVFLVMSLPGRPLAPAWLVAGAALLGVGAHVANVLPDLEADRTTGVHGLPHRLGRRGAALLAPAVLLTAVATVVAGPVPGPPSWVVVTAGLAAALAVGAGAVAVLRPRSRLPFTLSMGVAAVCVVVIVAAGPTVGAGA